MAISFTVNNKKINTELNPLTRLIDFLRDELKLTGTKEGYTETEKGKIVTKALLMKVLCNAVFVLLEW